MTAANLVELTRELIAIPSVSGEEEAMARRLETWFENVAGETTRVGKSVVHRGPSRPGRPLVLLAGHTDTVPPQGNEESSIQDGRLFGIGSCDMKSGLAWMLRAAHEFDLDALPFDLSWVCYECEEVSFERNGFRRIWQELEWVSGADLGILFEPTDGTLELGCQGSIQADVTVPGLAAHSARPWNGENAVYRAIPTLQRLSERGPAPVELGGVTFRETVQVTQASTDNKRNVVPPQFVFNVNFRFAPHRTVEEAQAELRSWIPAEFGVSYFDTSPAAAPRRDHPLIERLLATAEIPVRAKQGWTDVAQFAERGIAAVNFGPGDPELAHHPEESVLVSQIDDGYEVLRRFLSGA